MSRIYLKVHVELIRVLFFFYLCFLFLFMTLDILYWVWTYRKNGRNILEFIALFARRRKSTMEDVEKEEKETNRIGWIFCSWCARIRIISRSWSPQGHGLAHGVSWGPQREVSVLSFVLIMRPGHRRLYIKENNHRNRA